LIFCNMKIVFFGTPDYVLPIPISLHKTFKEKGLISPIAAVVTQAPKPTGRKKMLTYSPIDKWAHTHKVPIFYTPEDLLSKNIQADIGILASFGQIIPRGVLQHFHLGILNAHPSLLPKYRGASPVQATILLEETTGVSIIKLDEKLDHGPILTKFKEEIAPNDTTETLRKRLFERSAKVLVDLLPAYIKGKINLKPQKETEATTTKQITKQDGFIPPEYLTPTFKGRSFKGKWQVKFIKGCSLVPNAQNLSNFIRAMQPWPGAWTQIKLQGYKDTKLKRDKKTKIQSYKGTELQRLKILKAHLTIDHQSLAIDEVQLEGKNPVSWKQFCEAYPNNSLSELKPK
jgi:methionyl-tRNA formyltransferase